MDMTDYGKPVPARKTFLYSSPISSRHQQERGEGAGTGGRGGEGGVLKGECRYSDPSAPGGSWTNWWHKCCRPARRTALALTEALELSWGFSAYLSVQRADYSDLSRGAVHLEAVRAHDAVAQGGALGVFPLEGVDYVTDRGVLEEHQALHVGEEQRRSVAERI